MLSLVKHRQCHIHIVSNIYSFECLLRHLIYLNLYIDNPRKQRYCYMLKIAINCVLKHPSTCFLSSFDTQDCSKQRVIILAIHVDLCEIFFAASLPCWYCPLNFKPLCILGLKFTFLHTSSISVGIP